VTVSTVSTTGCGCCAGVSARTPLEVENRPGLSAVAYRVGTHADFLASMIAALTDVDRPRLAELATRDRDDFTIALLDAWAVAGDVLTFYNERLANEAYLRTARERISLQELGRLIGFRLRPGVAARTVLAFALEPSPETPAAASRDPGSAPPVTPSVVKLEEGLRVQSIPGPGEQPQTFETVEEIEARPEWNAIPASRTIGRLPQLGDQAAYLEGAALNLKPGDAFLLAGEAIPAEAWDLRTLSKVVPEPEADRTRIEWAEPLGHFDPLIHPAGTGKAAVLRKRINVFGHNAPLWRSMSSEFKTVYRGTAADPGDWPNFTLSPVSGFVVDLDGSHPDVVEGSWVVLSKPDPDSYRELWRVQLVTELSRAEFGVSGKVTRLTLEGGENYDRFHGKVRDTTVFAVSEPLTLADPPDSSDVEGDEIDVEVDVSEMRPGRRLLVSGTTPDGEERSEAAVLAEVQEAGGRFTLVLEDELEGTYERTTVVVHGNVAAATHGETVRQILGSGRASSAFQRFTLAHEPLTYLPSTDPSGAKAALEVSVNDVRWDEVPTLSGAGSRDRAYAVRVDEEGKTYVQLGDGERGARLPTGDNNVRARYRKGLGAAGNVGPKALAQLLDRPLGVKGVSNPVAATGGVDPEPDESARRSIPLAVRTLGRAVSLLDYEDFALAYTGVAKASATVLPLRAGRTVVLSVALTGSSGGEAAERLDDLAGALRDYGDPHVALAVVPSTEATFRLALKVAVDPAHDDDVVLPAVEAALRAAYAFDARDLAEPVERSEVVAVAHGVAGVLGVDVDRLYTGSTPDIADRLLAARAGVSTGGEPIAAGLLLLNPAPFDWLEVMT